jgi:hypothetical protein
VEFYLWFSADEELAVDRYKKQIACQQQNKLSIKTTLRIAQILDLFETVYGVACPRKRRNM